MNWLDLVLVAWVALSALVGFGRGLAAQVLSLVGLALGALAGSRIAPFFLSGGKSSPWVPLASLVGAIVGALLFQLGATFLGTAIRGVLARGPLRLADNAAGALAGTAIGLGVAWLAGVAALQVPESNLRQTVQQSAILSNLIEAVPPSTVLQALARFDPLPLIAAQPDLSLPPPDESLLDSPITAKASASVVKIYGVACGLGVQGSGWVAGEGLVATNAHVVAGIDAARIAAPNGQTVSGTVVYVDAANDVALISAPSLRAPPLAAAREVPDGDPVVLLGYPRDGPLTSVPGRAGRPRNILAEDAYGRRVRLRTVVPLRGRVQRGDSGGPVLNERGRVVAMIFAAARERTGGFGVPVSAVVKALGSPLRPVSTGPCT